MTATMSTIIHASAAPKFPLPFSHAVRAGDFLYVAGQVGVDPQTLEPIGGIKEQTEQCIRNIEVILQEAGLTLDHIVKATTHLATSRRSARIQRSVCAND